MVNYGIAYGLSAYGLSDRLNIEQEEAAAYIERYFERFPAVKKYIEETIAFAKENGYVTTLLGRRRPIPELRSGRPAGPRPGRAQRGQHADPGHLGRHHQDRDGPRPPRAGGVGAETRLVLQIHDELLFEGPAAEMEAAAELVERAMCGAFELDPPLAVDVGVGKDWLAAK